MNLEYELAFIDQRITSVLKREDGKLGRTVELMTRDALHYATERNSLWMKQDANRVKPKSAEVNKLHVEAFNGTSIEVNQEI